MSLCLSESWTYSTAVKTDLLLMFIVKENEKQLGTERMTEKHGKREKGQEKSGVVGGRQIGRENQGGAGIKYIYHTQIKTNLMIEIICSMKQCKSIKSIINLMLIYNIDLPPNRAD